MAEGWWTDLFAAAAWARARRFGVRGKHVPEDAIVAAVDFAAAALADPTLADALEAEHVDLTALENAFVHGVARACDLEAFRKGAGGVAWRRGATAVSIDDAFTSLLYVPEVADPALAYGVEVLHDRWAVVGLGAIKRGVVAAVERAWPFVGRREHEAIVVEDHDVVTRAFVFDLLVEHGQLSSIAALRAIRRIEAHGRASVFVGTRAQVDARWPHLQARLAAESSPLRMTREPA